MPMTNGTELAQKLIALCPEMKVVYMSGFTDDSVFLHGKLESPTHYIRKPFTPEALVCKVREALGPRNDSTTPQFPDSSGLRRPILLGIP